LNIIVPWFFSWQEKDARAATLFVFDRPAVIAYDSACLQPQALQAQGRQEGFQVGRW
jgi:hypothetical protein